MNDDTQTPPKLTMAEMDEKAATALRLVTELRRNDAFHGGYATFQDGLMAHALETACTALVTVAYYAELQHKSELAEQLAQVAARG